MVLVIDARLVSRVAAVYARLCGLRKGASPELDELLDREVAHLRARDAGRTAGQIERLAPARRLYRAIGLDPTRHRPSPEALLRRLLRGDPFPRVHPAVDLANLWACEHGLPVGLYDAGRIAGEHITLRLGLPGEKYAGIRRPEIHLEGRLVLADTDGPFGNPTADSRRTAVGPETRDVLAVLFAPADYPGDRLFSWLGWLEERARTLLGAGETRLGRAADAGSGSAR